MAERPGAAAKLAQKFRGGGEGGGGAARRRAVTAGCCGARRGAEPSSLPWGAGRTRPLRRDLPARRGSCPIPSHPIPSHPAPSRERARRDFPNSPRCGRGAWQPRSLAAVRPGPPPPCPTLRGTRGSLTPPLPASPRRGTAGTGEQRQDSRVQQRQQRGRDLALPPPEQMRSRSEEPPRPQAAPSPAARPAASAPLRSASRRAAERGVRCGARRAVRLPGAAPYF